MIIEVNGGYNGEGTRAFGEDEETFMVWLLDIRGGGYERGNIVDPARV